jgi:hypothetical protein
MQRNNPDKSGITEDQLLLYVSDQPPDEAWQHVAINYHWQMIHHSDLISVLGAFVMLMPGIVVIDRLGSVGNEALSHIESMLDNLPQPMLIFIELGIPDCTSPREWGMRLGRLAGTSPGTIFSQIDDCSWPA